MRIPGFWLWLSCSVGVLGCSSETAPTVYVGMSYQVRCIDCQPRAVDDAARSVKAVDSESGYKLTCKVDNDSGTKRVGFSIVHESANADQRYSLSVSHANLNDEESDGPCSVRVIEGANTYEGGCGSDDPTEDRPCKVSFEVKGGVLHGSLFCSKIASDATAAIVRYVAAPLSRDPSDFEIYGCTGL
jgi:hypothetical protein